MSIGIHPIEIILLLIIAFWLWMLVDCILNRSLRDTQKILWLLFILFTSIFGAIIYAIIGRSRKNVP